MVEEEALDSDAVEDVADGQEMVPLETSHHGKDLDGYTAPVPAGLWAIAIGRHKTSRKASLLMQNVESWNSNKKCFSRVLNQFRIP
jgi:hypothetical protein